LKKYFAPFGFIISIFILIVYLVYFLFNLPNKELEKNGLFTTVEIISIDTHPDAVSSADYVFIFKHKSYFGSFKIDWDLEGKIKKGSKFFIKFLERDPSIHRVVFDKKVPKDLKETQGGWKYIPTK
jgi:hypothetical protein